MEDNFGRGYGSPRTVMPEEGEVEEEEEEEKNRFHNFI
jgi:hypothetical protein